MRRLKRLRGRSEKYFGRTPTPILRLGASIKKRMAIDEVALVNWEQREGPHTPSAFVLRAPHPLRICFEGPTPPPHLF